MSRERFPDRYEAAAIGLGTGIALTLIVAELTGELNVKYEVLPTCADVKETNQALQPVLSKDVSRTIGKTAVCKVGDEVFRIVAASPQE